MSQCSWIFIQCASTCFQSKIRGDDLPSPMCCFRYTHEHGNVDEYLCCPIERLVFISDHWQGKLNYTYAYSVVIRVYDCMFSSFSDTFQNIIASLLQFYNNRGMLTRYPMLLNGHRDDPTHPECQEGPLSCIPLHPTAPLNQQVPGRSERISSYFSAIFTL